MIKHQRRARSVLCLLSLGWLLAGCTTMAPAPAPLDGPAGAVPEAADEAPFWYRLGNHRVNRGDWPGAAAAYRQALVADPGHYRARHNLGLVHARLSAEALSEAAAADPRAPDPAPLLRALYRPWLNDGAERPATP
ncbi:hypothetical protein ACN2MM_07985 [Alkalilimnicola ehrlichii MLHE-1]|uniref:Tetratricopeptide TPR_2 repeat protein n=1 Tax=Alkalilimnicola ehrlichii (strain ATCC BAA-1101 / DSM 17681 / MLHE-1) TaxID=187272 RepID=Q0A8M8_ALKEH|nr:TPR repeat-containing protein [Alkalilimnicola ehrlichii]ABI56809.1 Tetratricopeptide TPR_2 repeat protein [Alkalilimnicola ehrlichii MLHE-1]